MAPLGRVLGAGPAAALLGGIAVAYGGYRIYAFIDGIRKYREQTKAEWLSAPPSLLQLASRTSTSDLRFFRINDEVMGGKSSSQLGIGEDGKSLVLSGIINTNGGGFASCRTLGDDEPLGLRAGHSSALIVDATGDGQLYKVTLHTADSWSMGTPSWSHDFAPSAQRATHHLPLAEFIPSRQGQLVKGVALDATKVTGIGFGISLYTANGKPNTHNFGDGPFRLEVHRVVEVPDEQ